MSTAEGEGGEGVEVDGKESFNFSSFSATDSRLSLVVSIIATSWLSTRWKELGTVSTRLATDFDILSQVSFKAETVADVGSKAEAKHANSCFKNGFKPFIMSIVVPSLNFLFSIAKTNGTYVQ